MVFNTQDYWVFGLCPPSSILKKSDRLVLSDGQNKVGISFALS
jgi:hypothetical protein